MVYIQQVLLIKDLDFTITLGVVLIVASIITVVFGLFMDKIGKNRIMIPAIAVTVCGGIAMFFVNNQLGVMLAGTVLMSGYMIGTAVLGAKVRDYTPSKEVGLFQGVRMIFLVMIPMVTGPYIGQGASMINNEMTEGDFGQWSYAPTPYIFLFAAIAVLFVLIPLIILYKKEKQDEQVSA